jgi:RNA polymerase sigma-70 factor (ECF subfamily)
MGKNLAERRLEFQAFDADYVRKLTAGDPATEAHFSTYFGKFLSMKMRSRHLSPEMAEDVRQETLLRVLRTLRQGGGVAHPDRFGAFVNSVCNNVLLETMHRRSREGASPEDPPELADTRVDLDGSLVTAERRRVVARVLDELPAKDREVLRLVFFEDEDRKEICRKLGIDMDYLRVVLHRAKAKFQAAYIRKHGMITHVLLLLCNGPAAALTM